MSPNEFEANFGCCFMPKFTASLSIHYRYNSGSNKLLRKAGLHPGRMGLSSKVQKFCINDSTRIDLWCNLTNYSNGSFSACNHHIYMINCQMSGTITICTFNCILL